MEHEVKMLYGGGGSFTYIKHVWWWWENNDESDESMWTIGLSDVFICWKAKQNVNVCLITSSRSVIKSIFITSLIHKSQTFHWFEIVRNTRRMSEMVRIFRSFTKFFAVFYLLDFYFSKKKSAKKISTVAFVSTSVINL